MDKPKRNRLPTLLVCVSAMFCLLPIEQAYAQILPTAPNLAQRINVAPYAGIFRTNSQGIKGPELVVGFTAEATLFTLADCPLCPQEFGAGTAYLATGSRVQIQDLVWLSAYWFLPPDGAYIGIQGGYTNLTASAEDAADSKKTVFLEANGARLGLALGYQFHPRWYVEAAFAGRYFPVPKAVTAPLSSNPFGVFSAGITIGATFGDTLEEILERKASEKAQRDADIARWGIEQEHRDLQQKRWKKEDEERKGEGAKPN